MIFLNKPYFPKFWPISSLGKREKNGEGGGGLAKNVRAKFVLLPPPPNKKLDP